MEEHNVPKNYRIVGPTENLSNCRIVTAEEFQRRQAQGIGPPIGGNEPEDEEIRDLLIELLVRDNDRGYSDMPESQPLTVQVTAKVGRVEERFRATLEGRG